MENKHVTQGNADNKDNTIGGAPTNKPDPKAQNDTGFAGTTNAVSQNHQDKDGYRITPEDTMIGYDGNDEQMNMSLNEKEDRRSGKTGVDDSNS